MAQIAGYTDADTRWREAKSNDKFETDETNRNKRVECPERCLFQRTWEPGMTTASRDPCWRARRASRLTGRTQSLVPSLRPGESVEVALLEQPERHTIQCCNYRHEA